MRRKKNLIQRFCHDFLQLLYGQNGQNLATCNGDRTISKIRVKMVKLFPTQKIEPAPQTTIYSSNQIQCMHHCWKRDHTYLHYLIISLHIL